MWPRYDQICDSIWSEVWVNPRRQVFAGNEAHESIQAFGIGEMICEWGFLFIAMFDKWVIVDICWYDIYDIYIYMSLCVCWYVDGFTANYLVLLGYSDPPFIFHQLYDLSYQLVEHPWISQKYYDSPAKWQYHAIFQTMFTMASKLDVANK